MRLRPFLVALAGVAALLLAAPVAIAATPAQDPPGGLAVCLDAEADLSAGRTLIANVDAAAAVVATATDNAEGALDGPVPTTVDAVNAALSGVLDGSDESNALLQLRAALEAEANAERLAADVDLDALTGARDNACADEGQGPTTGPTPPGGPVAPGPDAGDGIGVGGSGNDLYSSCADARAAGAAPLAIGEAGYRVELDSDGDGTACEDSEGATAGDGFGQTGTVPSGSADTGSA